MYLSALGAKWGMELFKLDNKHTTHLQCLCNLHWHIPVSRSLTPNIQFLQTYHIGLMALQHGNDIVQLVAPFNVPLNTLEHWGSANCITDSRSLFQSCFQGIGTKVIGNGRTWSSLGWITAGAGGLPTHSWFSVAM